jgi:hypothetical protein
MNKFFIFLSFLLILFGVSTLYAEVYVEDFEDGAINPDWSVRGVYDIENGIFHMKQGEYQSNNETNSSAIIIWEENFIYKFEVDIYKSSSSVQALGFDYILTGTSGVQWEIGLWMHEFGSQFIAHIEKDEDRNDAIPSVLLGTEVLGPANLDEWYSLSIIIHDDYVTIGINGNMTDIFSGVFSRGHEEWSAVEIKGHTGIPNDVDYRVDNIKVNTAFRADYTFKSVWNERISYDPAYFNLGTFNDIIAGAIVSGLPASEAESILHTIKWTPADGSQQEKVLSYEGEHFGNQWFLGALDHDVEASSFPMWEDMNYDFYIDGIFQSPSVFTSSGSFSELTTPTTTYDPSTHVITWQTVESRNYRVRILGSTYQDDILFDSVTIIDNETYQFIDPFALSLLDAGAIIAVEARQFKSATELLNTSIYITKTEPVPKPVTIASGFYDRFENAPMNMDKWRWGELVRDVSDGKLHIATQSCTGGSVGATPTAEDFSFMKANISVDSDSYIPESAWAHIRMKGEFYNDTRGPGSGLEYNGNEGDVRAEIMINYDGDNALLARAQVWRFDEADPNGSHTTFFSQDFTTPITVDTEYELSIEFTGTSFIFKCNSETFTHQVSGPTYSTYAKTRFIDSQYFRKSNTRTCGYMKSTVDNFYIDKIQTPYDTFDGDQLDASKWKYGEFIREIVDGKCRLKVERCNARGNNSISPIATNESGYLEAKVTVNSGSVAQGNSGSARVNTYFYNEKRGPGSGLDYNEYQDNVWIQTRINLDETGKLVAQAIAWRTDAPDESTGTGLFREDFKLPIEWGQEYTLSIMFKGSKIIYKCNNEMITYDIQTPTYEPYDKHYYLQSRIYNGDQQCGYIDATFDDIRIRPAVTSMPAVQLLLLSE